MVTDDEKEVLDLLIDKDESGIPPQVPSILEESRSAALLDVTEPKTRSRHGRPRAKTNTKKSNTRE